MSTPSLTVGPARPTTTRERVLGSAAFLLYGGLWAAFGFALAANPAALDDVWAWLVSLPLVVQALVWFLFLPLAAGLWVWQTDWPLALRLLLEVALAAVTIYMFFPKWMLPRGREGTSQ